MSDWDTFQNVTDTVQAAHELNKVSQPLGYAVTCSAGGRLGDDQAADRQQFTVHRIDKPVGRGPTFDTPGETAAYLEQIAELPLWRLDLDDDSVEFDGPELTIKDKRTGESFCLKGWSLGVTGRPGAGPSAGAAEGVTHLSVRTDEPPTIGRWYKSDRG